MKKTANFIVNKRGIVMSAIFLLAAICAFLMQQVEINSDMTKYLADDSSMKIGMDIMEDEFPEIESSQAIRVMFQNLEAEQKSEVLSQMENIEYLRYWTDPCQIKDMETVRQYRSMCRTCRRQKKYYWL